MTELPDSLLRFAAQLERAAERDLRRAPRGERRRVAVTMSAAAAGAAAIALGAVSLLGDDAPVGRSGVAHAAPHERAVAALRPREPAIVHAVAITRHVAADGSVSAWRQESWRQTARPFARREVTTPDGGPPLETATSGRAPTVLYDAATDTLYTDPPSDGPALGTPEPAREGDPLRAQLLGLLRSGGARGATETSHHGRPAIRFELRDAWPDGSVVRWAYLVDAQTYAPIELTAASPDGARTTTRFERYELLPDDDQSRKLLDLRAQHPGASVDATERGYAEATARAAAVPGPAG
ncbi:MAG TPA: hypothetical protein VIL49_04000 [Capillimicrobium sp.]|jgi:hypothetical protein